MNFWLRLNSFPKPHAAVKIHRTAGIHRHGVCTPFLATVLLQHHIVVGKVAVHIKVEAGAAALHKHKIVYIKRRAFGRLQVRIAIPDIKRIGAVGHRCQVVDLRCRNGLVDLCRKLFPVEERMAAG
jgi:hypothetical protein